MRLLTIGAILAIGWSGNLAAQSPPTDTRGRTDPYIDARHLTSLPFGAHSYWLQPWRAYQVDYPRPQFLDAQGIGLNLSQGEDPELVVPMLAGHGITKGRIEIGWGSVRFDDETRLNDEERLTGLLIACKRHRDTTLDPAQRPFRRPLPDGHVRAASRRDAKKGDRMPWSR